jgi:uncharacterized protein YggT (Ycf19 family)
MDKSDPKQVTVWLARAVAYLAYAYLMITQIMLIQGFLLRLFGANPGSSYVDWVYRSLDRVMAPFRGMFESIELDGNSVLDTSIIFAMVIYGILALLVNSLLEWLTYRLNRLDRKRQLEEANERSAQGQVYESSYSAAAYQAPAVDPAAPASQAAPADPGASPYPDQGTPHTPAH